MMNSGKEFHLLSSEHYLHFRMQSLLWAIESVSRLIMNFGVLNNNLIKDLISYVKCINKFLMKVQIYSLIHHLKYNYEANGIMRSTYLVNK
jgi:hypothetical protein